MLPPLERAENYTVPLLARMTVCLMQFHHAEMHIFLIHEGTMGLFRFSFNLRQISALICTAYFQKGVAG
jgi:hypothetical protein